MSHAHLPPRYRNAIDQVKTVGALVLVAVVILLLGLDHVLPSWLDQHFVFFVKMALILGSIFVASCLYSYAVVVIEKRYAAEQQAIRQRHIEQIAMVEAANLRTRIKTLEREIHHVRTTGTEVSR